MPSPHPAVTPAAIAIAIKYGKNVSRGILEMEAVIQRLEREKEIGRADRERTLEKMLTHQKEKGVTRG